MKFAAAHYLGLMLQRRFVTRFLDLVCCFAVSVEGTSKEALSIELMDVRIVRLATGLRQHYNLVFELSTVAVLDVYLMVKLMDVHIVHFATEFHPHYNLACELSMVVVGLVGGVTLQEKEKDFQVTIVAENQLKWGLKRLALG